MEEAEDVEDEEEDLQALQPSPSFDLSCPDGAAGPQKKVRGQEKTFPDVDLRISGLAKEEEATQPWTQ